MIKTKQQYISLKIWYNNMSSFLFQNTVQLTLLGMHQCLPGMHQCSHVVPQTIVLTIVVKVLGIPYFKCMISYMISCTTWLLCSTHPFLPLKNAFWIFSSDNFIIVYYKVMKSVPYNLVEDLSRTRGERCHSKVGGHAGVSFIVK